MRKLFEKLLDRIFGKQLETLIERRMQAHDMD